MKIAVCEDEQYWSESLRTSVVKWGSERRREIEFNSFSSPQDTIDHLAVNEDTDALFLDISLGEKVIDGMTLAKRIRKTGNEIPIIFVTVDAYRAADGYLVEAMGFLTKPINENRLTLFLDRIVNQKIGNKIIRVMTEGRISNIAQKDIVYIEIDDHTIIYHTTHASLSCRETLAEVITTLNAECFIQIHRSYVIALDKINSVRTTYPYSVDLLKNKEIMTLPVSRKYINGLMEVYSDDILEKMI